MKGSSAENLIVDKQDWEAVTNFLKQSRGFRELMLQYRCALMEIETKFQVLDEEFSIHNDRNPIESIQTRLKEPMSIEEKMRRKGIPFSLDAMQENILDIAGVRVICSFIEDVYYLADCIASQTDIEVISVKDYIKNPKPNGYRSYHMTVRIPIFFSEETLLVPVEIQFRTIAMDFWASVEHTIRYKKNLDDNGTIARELLECAESSKLWDERMQRLKHTLDDITRDGTSRENR